MSATLPDTLWVKRAAADQVTAVCFVADWTCIVEPLTSAMRPLTPG